MAGPLGAMTFATQLRHFARAVDIVDDGTFDRVRALVYRYVMNELGAEYFELMRDELIGQEPGLRMFWSSENLNHLWPVRGRDTPYTNPVTQSFGQNRPLWLVAKGKGTLRDAKEVEDLWGHTADLPPYEPSVDRSIRTLVTVPLQAKRPLGVYLFESRTYLGITEVARNELVMLGNALAILLDLYEVNRTQSRMTESAIFDLQGNLESAKFPRLAKPRFFFASSTRADRSVIMVINEVLQEFDDRLEFTDWSRMSESGNIAAQIAREITQSRFGICYLSEPAGQGARFAYVDNPNVVFEAGMLHATTAANEPGAVGEPTGWIPVREESSPPAPFDFAAERTVYVPRFHDGRLNQDRLREMLTERVLRLLGDE
jgi:hypothetical protein